MGKPAAAMSCSELGLQCQKILYRECKKTARCTISSGCNKSNELCYLKIRPGCSEHRQMPAQVGPENGNVGLSTDGLMIKGIGKLEDDDELALP